CSSTGADLDSFLRRVRSVASESIGAAPPVGSKEGRRLLLMAAVRGKAEAVEELLRRGLDPNAPALLSGNERSTHGLPMLPITPLCGALARSRAAVAGLLVRRGAFYDVFTAASL